MHHAASTRIRKQPCDAIDVNNITAARMAIMTAPIAANPVRQCCHGRNAMTMTMHNRDNFEVQKTTATTVQIGTRTFSMTVPRLQAFKSMLGEGLVNQGTR